MKATRATAEIPTKPRQRQKCPACHRLMNICEEAKDLFYCQECDIHLKGGQAVTVDANGNFRPVLGQMKLVEKDDLPKEQPNISNIDVYFASGDKKCFRGVSMGGSPRQGWIVLTKPDGKEICINASNVNYIEEV